MKKKKKKIMTKKMMIKKKKEKIEEEEVDEQPIKENSDPKRIIMNSQYLVQSLGYGSIVIWIISKDKKKNK